MAESTVKELDAILSKLEKERQTHLDAVHAIDQVFARYGIKPEAVGSTPTSGKTRGPGRPPTAAGTTAPPQTTTKKTGGKKRGRGAFKETAEEFVQNLLGGGKTMTTADINKAWSKAGRAGSAGNTLTKLTKAGVLARENIPGARGSQYRLA